MVFENFADDEGAEINLEGPITLDLGAIKDEPVSVGWHSVTIERAEAKETRQQSLPSIFVLARVNDEADPDYNRTVIWNLMLSGDGLLFTKRCFGALGMPEQIQAPSVQALADELVGRDVEVQVKHRTYEGAIQANANNWRQPTMGGIEFE